MGGGFLFLLFWQCLSNFPKVLFFLFLSFHLVCSSSSEGGARMEIERKERGWDREQEKPVGVGEKKKEEEEG